MNEFTKTDLREIHRCLKYMTKGGTTPYSCHTIALIKKVQNMFDNFCDHEMEEYGSSNFKVCRKCDIVIGKLS